MRDLELLLKPKNKTAQRIVAGVANKPWESRFYVRSNLRDSRPVEIEVEYAIQSATAAQVRHLAELFGGNDKFEASLSKIDTSSGFHDETSLLEVHSNKKRLMVKVAEDSQGNEREKAVRYLNQVLEALGVKERYDGGAFNSRNVPDLSPKNIARAYSSMRSNYYRSIASGSNERGFYVSESKGDKRYTTIHFTIKNPDGRVSPQDIRLLERTISYLGVRLSNTTFLIDEQLGGDKRDTYRKRLK